MTIYAWKFGGKDIVSCTALTATALHSHTAFQRKCSRTIYPNEEMYYTHIQALACFSCRASNSLSHRSRS